MNQYETVFILTPVLSDDQMKEAVAKFKKLLTDNGAEILNEETWGLKKWLMLFRRNQQVFTACLNSRLSLLSLRHSKQASAATRKSFVS